MSFAWRVPKRVRAAAVRCAIAPLALGVALGFAASAQGAIPSWTTYHHDAARSGVDPESTSPLPPAKLWSTELDGVVYAEPLVYGPYVYVATENDSIYSIDTATGAIHWKAHVGTPVPSRELPCGDIEPTVGITSTPVIDPETNTIYAVADGVEGAHASISHKLVALDLETGAMREHFPRDVDPPYPVGGEPRNQLQRAGLALDGSEVVIGYGGNNGDCATYWGWLVGASVSGTGPLKSYQVESEPGHLQGAIWGSGNAPAIDSSGDIYAATGNGCTQNPCSSEHGSEFDFGESVLKLNPNLELLEFWAPANWQERDESDLDLGSSNPVLLPGGKVFQVSKTGNEATLLYGNALGGVAGATASTFEVCPGSGSWGGGIYVPASAEAGTLYVTCDDGLHAVSVSELCSPHPRVSQPPGWQVNGNAVGPPIFAGGLVWVASWYTGSLYGLDPTSGGVRFEEPLGGFEHFATPSAAGGRLFVGNDNHLTAFGIAAATPEPTPLTPALCSPGGAPAGSPLAPSTSSPPTQVGTAPPNPRPLPTLPLLYGAKQSHTRWREGDALARISGVGEPQRAGAAAVNRRRRQHLPVGDTFSFTLSRAASVRFAFTQSAPGRRVGDRCVAPAKHHGKAIPPLARCTRVVIAETLGFSGRAGVDSVHFDGRISRRKRLPGGSYTVGITASAAPGQSSPPQDLRFTIVRS